MEAALRRPGVGRREKHQVRLTGAERGRDSAGVVVLTCGLRFGDLGSWRVVLRTGIRCTTDAELLGEA